ncbi:protein FANTASTIC FOUR 2 [Senna tora]|uniref:Protein FANTASTIC FOUR 2 n=1 Tax=Senna tora TaxID=362788 RepID=A0A834T9T2_9FABA|nr:protein FANTASTIC FOUR 2 [Senna tora]
MSSSSVRQGLQSCVMESQVLRLKLAPPPPPVVSLSEEKSMRNDETHKTKKKDGDVGGWSFLHECLNKTEDSQPQNVYVHPTLKHSSSMLSNESLEMCTESLGCETGTITNNIASGDMDEIGLLSLETSTTRRQSEEEGCRRSVWKRIRSRSRSFPPPLTSMREMGGVGVIRPHREEGRLILKLEAPPSAHPYFEAERSNGRLRLRLFHSTHHETISVVMIGRLEFEDVRPPS